MSGNAFYTGVTATSELTPVVVVKTTNINVNAAPNTVDGLALSAGDRVLVVGQSVASQNGIYVVSFVGSGSNGIWIRASDLLSGSQPTTAGNDSLTLSKMPKPKSAVSVIICSLLVISLNNKSAHSFLIILHSPQVS